MVICSCIINQPTGVFNMSKQPTKEVQGCFGTRQMTRDEYVQHWQNLISDLMLIADCSNPTDYEFIQKTTQKVMEMAGARWDKL